MYKIIDLWSKELSPIFEDLWVSLTFWRVLALLLLTLITLTLKFRKWIISRLVVKADIVKHDASVFRRAEEIMSENHFDSIVSNLYHGRAIYMSDVDTLVGFCHCLSLEGNKYLFKKIDKCVSELLSSINALLNFSGNHFETSQEQPAISKIMDFADGAILDEFVNDVSNKYLKYRRAIKIMLKI